MLENKNDEVYISEQMIYKVKSTITSKYSHLDSIEIENLMQESINFYNRFMVENPNLKIIISRFLIFYISKKVELNLSEDNMMEILDKNIDLFKGNLFKGNQSKEIAVKNFEEGTSLLHSRYGDNNSSSDISIKK